jgi:hypothetical protein
MARFFVGTAVRSDLSRLSSGFILSGIVMTNVWWPDVTTRFNVLLDVILTIIPSIFNEIRVFNVKRGIYLLHDTPIA